MKTVEHEAPLLFVLHDPGLTKHAEVMRDIDNFLVEQLPDLGHMFAAVAQALDYTQPFWLALSTSSGHSAERR